MCDFMQRANGDTENQKGDDTMSAVAKNFVYEVRVKKGDSKPEPVVDKKRIEEFKKAVSKYLGENK